MNRISYITVIIGVSFLLSMIIMNVFLTIDYCWNGGLCLSVQGGESDGALIIPWVEEIRILIESIISPVTWALTIILIPVIGLGGPKIYEWWTL